MPAIAHRKYTGVTLRGISRGRSSKYITYVYRRGGGALRSLFSHRALKRRIITRVPVILIYLTLLGGNDLSHSDRIIMRARVLVLLVVVVILVVRSVHGLQLLDTSHGHELVRVQVVT